MPLEKYSTKKLKQKHAQVVWAEFPAKNRSPEATEGAAGTCPEEKDFAGLDLWF